MRSRSVLALLLAPLSVAAMAACGDDPADAPSASPSTSVPAGDGTLPPPPTSSGDTGTAGDATGYEVPTGADDVVISVGHEGGFVPQGAAFAQVPTVLVSGDGRAITPGMITLQYPGPLRLPLMQRTITPEGVQTLLATADELGLLAEVEYDNDMTVADAPDTVVRITVDGVTYEHRAYALDIGRGEPDEARANLSAFVEAASDLAGTVGDDALGEEQPFAAEQVLFQAYPVDESEVGDVTDPTVATTVEPTVIDSTVVGATPPPLDDLVPTIVEWPEDASVRLADGAECAALPAAEADALFDEANQETLFRDEGVLYRLSVVDQFPGRSC